MKTAAKSSASAILRDVWEWSQGLPDWQRDALRRIVHNGVLSESDFSELALMCKKPRDLTGDDEVVPEAVSLLENELPQGLRSGSTVSILAISNIEHVNAVCGRQRLEFGENGLTIVFGYNGSGKSGYGRILRRACRARARGDAIKPNVMKPAPTSPASAEITYAVDGQEQPPEQWVDGERDVDCLGAVSFFDADCARVHVDDRNDIAFVPFGFDVLPKLADACIGVKGQLEREQEALEGRTSVFLRDNRTRTDTEVGRLLRSLSAQTKTDDLEQLASLTDQEGGRMAQLRVELAGDPRKTAAACEACDRCQQCFGNGQIFYRTILLRNCTSARTTRKQRRRRRNWRRKWYFRVHPWRVLEAMCGGSYGKRHGGTRRRSPTSGTRSPWFMMGQNVYCASRNSVLTRRIVFGSLRISSETRRQKKYASQLQTLSAVETSWLRLLHETSA